MDELMALGRGADEGMEGHEPGSTFVFGPDGWEAVDYVDPSTDWDLQPDGSFVSPDGSTRTWPLAGPEPA
jgi:hypothetical protein